MKAVEVSSTTERVTMRSATRNKSTNIHRREIVTFTINPVTYEELVALAGVSAPTLAQYRPAGATDLGLPKPFVLPQVAKFGLDNHGWV